MHTFPGLTICLAKPSGRSNTVFGLLAECDAFPCSALVTSLANAGTSLSSGNSSALTRSSPLTTLKQSSTKPEPSSDTDEICLLMKPVKSSMTLARI